MRIWTHAALFVATALLAASHVTPALHLSASPAARVQFEGAAAPLFDELYRRGRALNADLATLSARFTETTSSALLERPIVERGMLFVERATPRVALRYDGSDRVLLIDGDRMRTVWPSRKLDQIRDVGATRRRIQGYFEDADASELRRVFDIEVRARSERPGTREIVLRPKRRQISETLSRIELWVEDATALMRAMRLTFSSGDTKLMEFEDVTRNAVIGESAFSASR